MKYWVRELSLTEQNVTTDEALVSINSILIIPETEAPNGFFKKQKLPTIFT